MKFPYTELADERFIERVAQQSPLKDGPLHARELLNNQGIQLVILPHLKNTYLDGAVMLLKNGTPVIGLTLRYDRLDNFWFSLMHELAHLVKHLNGNKTPIFDDLDYNDDIPEIEVEADKMAEKALIPSESWSKDSSEYFGSEGSIDELRKYARKLHIHESILAGRIQHDTGNYRRFRQLLGNGVPSKLFGITFYK